MVIDAAKGRLRKFPIIALKFYLFRRNGIRINCVTHILFLEFIVVGDCLAPEW